MVSNYDIPLYKDAMLYGHNHLKMITGRTYQLYNQVIMPTL